MKNNEIEDIRKRWSKYFESSLNHSLQEHDSEEQYQAYLKMEEVQPSFYQAEEDIRKLLGHEDRQHVRLIVVISALQQIKETLDHCEPIISPWGIQSDVDDALDSIFKSLKEDGYDDPSTD